MSTGNLNDGFVALKDGKMVIAARPVSDGLLRQGTSTAASTIRTPAGRAAGCGAPTATARRGSMEGGKGTKPLAVHFQMRPDPLAN